MAEPQTTAEKLSDALVALWRLRSCDDLPRHALRAIESCEELIELYADDAPGRAVHLQAVR